MDRVWCEAGKERYDVCQQSSAMIERLEQQQQAWAVQDQTLQDEARDEG